MHNVADLVSRRAVGWKVLQRCRPGPLGRQSLQPDPEQLDSHAGHIAGVQRLHLIEPCHDAGDAPIVGGGLLYGFGPGGERMQDHYSRRHPRHLDDLVPPVRHLVPSLLVMKLMPGAN